MATEALSPRPSLARAAATLRPRLGRWGLRGTALLYLGGMIALPLAAIIAKGYGRGTEALTAALASPGAWEAIRLTLVTSALAATINALFGTVLAYALVRYRFAGRTLLSGIIDLPFAIPTLVTGVMLVALYGQASPVGQWLADNGLEVAFTPLGVLLALLIITLPFVVRSVQPVLAELDTAEEEAAYVLGATTWKTFWRVVFPALRPAIAAGALLSFARALGEFGSIVIVSGNITGKTLTAPVFIFQLASQFRPEEAAAVSALLFGTSFALVLVVYRLLLRGSEAV
ncbi:MAG TPA: sulfate ABC transporter permease subunit CysT [Actinomycetota bacterium]|nr:sulfate ABC transporter permease subunit CysT [Actinomycetota bacterium]